MNPASASMPAPAEMPTAPNVVANIPVHNQAAPAPQVNEDVELDKIMHDVGQEMKKEDTKPPKHGFLNFGHKPRSEAHFSAQAIQRSQPTPMATAPPQPVAAVAAPAPAAPVAGSPAQPQVAAKVAKPQSHKSVPVFVIFVAFLVTGFLVAAAIAAYRQT